MSRSSSPVPVRQLDPNILKEIKERQAKLRPIPFSPELSRTSISDFVLQERLERLVNKRRDLETTLEKEIEAKEELQQRYNTLNASFLATSENLTRISSLRQNKKKSRTMIRKPSFTERTRENLLTNAKEQGYWVPEVINGAIKFLKNHLEVEDMFSHTLTDGEKESLREALQKEDSSQAVSTSTDLKFAAFNSQPHLVAAFLMDYLQDLPEPLIVQSLYDLLISINEIENLSIRLSILRSIILTLPKENTVMLMKILSLLNSFLACSEKNGLSLEKIGSILGPLLLRSPNPNLEPSSEVIKAQSETCQLLVSDYHRLFHSPDDIKYKDSQIEFASVDKLIEKLLDEFSPDTNFPLLFFFCHEYFIQTDQLLQRILKMYKSMSSTSTWDTRLRLRLISILKLWTEQQQGELETLRFLQEIQKFFSHLRVIKFPSSPQETATIDQIKTWIYECIHRTSNSESMYITPRLYARSNPSAKLKIEVLEMLELNPLEVAEQLTLIDHGLFTKIPPREFLMKSFNKPEESPNFTEMVAMFNRWAHWTSNEILKKDNVFQRAEVMTKFIRIAKRCVRLRNYNTSCAIIGGLNHSAISRLKLSWERISRNYLRKYDKLVNLFSMESNFRNYRKEFPQFEALNFQRRSQAVTPPTTHHNTPTPLLNLQSSPSLTQYDTKPFVPYLALYSKDVSALEENYNNFTEEGLVNFHKMRLLWKTVKVPLATQRAYNISENLSIMFFLKEVVIPKEEEFFQRSLICEPRKPAS